MHTRASEAAEALSALSKLTKPNPRDLPVSLSTIRRTEVSLPYSENKSDKSFLVASQLRLPMNKLVLGASLQKVRTEVRRAALLQIRVERDNMFGFGVCCSKKTFGIRTGLSSSTPSIASLEQRATVFQNFISFSGPVSCWPNQSVPLLLSRYSATKSLIFNINSGFASKTRENKLELKSNQDSLISILQAGMLVLVGSAKVSPSVPFTSQTISFASSKRPRISQTHRFFGTSETRQEDTVLCNFGNIHC